MKTIRLFVITSMLASAAFAGPLVFEPSDTTTTILKKQAGQKVELRMKSGEKLAGTVKAVGEKAVHLSTLAGQEFFDAVVALEDISAVIVHTGGK